MRRLLYFGHKSSIHSISRPPSPVPTNSSENDLVQQTKNSFIKQNEIAYISFRFTTLTDWLFCGANSVPRHPLTFSCSIFGPPIDWPNQREVAIAALISDLSRGCDESIATTLTFYVTVYIYTCMLCNNVLIKLHRNWAREVKEQQKTFCFHPYILC